LTLIEEGGYSPANPFVKILSGIEKWGYKNSDLVVGTMPNISEHVNSVCKKEMNCACVPFGFILDDYKEMLAQEVNNNRYAIPANKFIIGYAGRHRIVKWIRHFY
jgi:hypothetical protein